MLKIATFVVVIAIAAAIVLSRNHEPQEEAQTPREAVEYAEVEEEGHHSMEGVVCTSDCPLITPETAP